jgi:hypothetical protein
MDYIKNHYYFIENVEVPIGYPVFPIKDAKYIKSYNDNGKKSLIFEYKIKKSDFYDWGLCWIHIAQNHTKGKSDENDYIIETHIYEDKIIKISKNYYVLNVERCCGGGTLSFCQREESALWPKYIDENGEKRCIACGCRGPMIDHAILKLINNFE